MPPISHPRSQYSNINHRYPLVQFVLEDLPSSTKAPELDDSNAVTALKKYAGWTKDDFSQGAGVSVETMGIYLAYLIAIGFMPAPGKKGELVLPEVTLTEEARQSLKAVGGRGGAA
jgi:L-aminoadipate-semialdehyde dehydrogenase